MYFFILGVNRHFQMVFLHDKFNGALDRKISAKEIWSHLMEMYDLNALVCFLHVFVLTLQI